MGCFEGGVSVGVAVLVCEFFFDRRTKEHILSFGRFSYEAYVLVSGLFFTLAFGRLLILLSC